MTDPVDAPVSRRLLLRATAVAAVVGLAGCGTVDNYEFSADPVVLPAPARDRLGYRERLREPLVLQRSAAVAGTDVTVTVESPVAVYETTPGVTPADPVLGVASTPPASIRDRSLNPLARRSRSGVLASEAGGRLLDRLDVGGDGASGGVGWRRPPTRLRDRSARCLGRETTVESYAGLVAGDPDRVVGLHLTRAAVDSVVLAVAAHGCDAAEDDRSLVGPDGHLTPDEFVAVADLVAETTPALRYA